MYIHTLTLYLRPFLNQTKVSFTSVLAEVTPETEFLQADFRLEIWKDHSVKQIYNLKIRLHLFEGKFLTNTFNMKRSLG